MINATAVPSSIASRLPYINIDLSRFMGNDAIVDTHLRDAYAQFSTTYGNLVDAEFNEDFLANAGTPTIRSYVAGKLDRHEAAIELANLWDSALVPVGSVERKRRIADATMAADRLLHWYDAERSGHSMVVEPPVVSVIETPAAPTPVVFAEGKLCLSIDRSAEEAKSAHISAQGVMDRGSSHMFLAQTQRLYQQGIRRLTLDLGDVDQVNLSGIYALHATAKVFNGASYPSSEYGMAGLRHMVEENLEAGVHENIRLQSIHPHIAGQLQQTGITKIFGM